MTDPYSHAPADLNDAADESGVRRRAEQDGEYLHEARNVVMAALADFDPDARGEGFWQDIADGVLDRLADHGWHLLTYEDAEKMLNAYVLGQVR